MQILIHAPWEVNPYMKDLIEQKVQKLTTYESHIQRAEVFLKDGQGETVRDKNVEIRLKTTYSKVFAQDTADELEKALANTVEKLRKQLIKKKGKLHSHN